MGGGLGRRLKLRVASGARRPGFAGRHGDAWKVRVSEPAEGGRANEAVLRLIADALGVSRRDVELVSGHTSHDKVVAVNAAVDIERVLEGHA